MPFGQREKCVRQSAERAGMARDPMETAETEARFGGNLEPPKTQRESRGAGRPNRSTEGHPSESMVRCSKPTISWYAIVIAMKVTGIATKTPTMQQITPSRVTPAIASKNMVKPK